MGADAFFLVKKEAKKHPCGIFFYRNWSFMLAAGDRFHKNWHIVTLRGMKYWDKIGNWVCQVPSRGAAPQVIELTLLMA